MDRLPPPPLPDFITRQLPARLERYVVHAAGHQVHVMAAGEGRPVVMLHGNPTWGFLYRRVVDALEGQRFRIILPDLVGLGFSDKPRDARFHTIENHARVVGAVMDAHAISDAIVVVQDWGGPIALRALVDRVGMASGLVILNTSVGPPRPGFRPTLFHRFARLPVASEVAFRLLGFPQRALWTAQGDHRSIRGDVARAYAYPLRSLRENAAPLALARMVPDSPDHPSMPALRRCQEFVERFQGPISIVWGDRDPVLGGVVRWLQKLLPHAELTRTNAGHFLQEQVFDEIALAVQRVDRRIGA